MGNPAATASVLQRLERFRSQGTASERAVASYMLGNLNSLPFETSASLAAKLGLSETTVGRFCRHLGFRHFKDLKQNLRDDLGDSPWLMGERLQDFLQRRSTDGPDYSRSLELSIAAQVAVYELTHAPQWQPVVTRLAQCKTVLVAGFQTERGVAASMAHLLQYIRPGVHLIDNAAGHYSDALLADPTETALVVFDARRYSRHALLLCRKARDHGLPVTLVTDMYCDWADSSATEVFRVPTGLDLFWECTAPMQVLAHLMVNEVFVRLGKPAEQRLEQIAGLNHAFIGYTSAQDAFS
ncbi:MurR/RpiR family transcriptional regulator [Kerstersia similis]|uniref:MurR/RpiR family transcriptional regulator n=1 Tax=Kerstersia similis TaxID=206505 RepID=UPI0039EE503E